MISLICLLVTTALFGFNVGMFTSNTINKANYEVIKINKLGSVVTFILVLINFITYIYI